MVTAILTPSPFAFAADRSGRYPGWDEPAGREGLLVIDAPPIRILVADELTIVRAGLRNIFAQHTDLKIIGEATSVADALRQSADLRPHVIVLNSMAQASNALDIARTISKRCAGRSPGMLLLANSPDQYTREVLRAGATGLVLHHSNPEHLIAAVRMVAAGYWVVADAQPPVPHYEQIDMNVMANGTISRDLEGVSRRELEVLRLVARGLSNAEIARELTLSESTVKSHIQHLLDKLRLRNRVHAVIFAYEVGLIRIGSRAIPSRA
jgi:DNA-binding NarL/FixJ family response regulator